MKKILLALIITTISYAGFSQQQPMYTHYMENTLSINPAYAGSRDALTVLLLNRMQWVGFKGAPITQTLTMHSPFLNNKLGAGLSFVNDRIGPSGTTSMFLDFAYRIKFKHSYLALGLKTGFSLLKLDLADLNLNRTNDPVFSQNFQSQWMPNFGFGIYYNTDKYYFGFSIPEILNIDLLNNSVQSNLIQTARHYYFIAGGYVNLNKDIKFLPSSFVKFTPNAPIEMDLTAQLIYKNVVYGGLMYRTGDALGLLLGVYLTPLLTVGYSFDWSMVNKTGKYNFGSHEFMIRYDFLLMTPKKKIISPRFF